MTSERTGKIHRNAQENFLASKLEEIVTATITMCNEKANWWACFKSFDLARYQRELSDMAVQNAVRAFDFEGFQTSTLASIIRETMWSSSNSSVSSYLKMLGMGVLVSAWGAAHIGFPLLTLVALPANLVYNTGWSLKNSHVLVMSCVEVILVFDRMFWYGDRRIEEKHVRAALMYYLKIRPQVMAELNKSLNITDKISEMAPTLSKIINQHRYRPGFRVVQQRNEELGSATDDLSADRPPSPTHNSASSPGPGTELIAGLPKPSIDSHTVPMNAFSNYLF